VTEETVEHQVRNTTQQTRMTVLRQIKLLIHLLNYKIPVKTQHTVSIMLSSDMFRLE